MPMFSWFFSVPTKKFLNSSLLQSRPLSLKNFEPMPPSTHRCFCLRYGQTSPKNRERDLVFPGQAMKACKETRGIPPLILNLDTRRKSMVNFSPWPLCPRGRTPVVIEQEAELASGPVCTFWRRGKFPCRDSNPGLLSP